MVGKFVRGTFRDVCMARTVQLSSLDNGVVILGLVMRSWSAKWSKSPCPQVLRVPLSENENDVVSDRMVLRQALSGAL